MPPRVTPPRTDTVRVRLDLAYDGTEFSGWARQPGRRTVAWPKPLDIDAMNIAAAGLVGEYDFAAFCRPRVGGSTVRTLQRLAAARDPAGVIGIEAHADAFCHNQVRSMVGALFAVGEGR